MGARFGGPYPRFANPPRTQAFDGGWRHAIGAVLVLVRCGPICGLLARAFEPSVLESSDATVAFADDDQRERDEEARGSAPSHRGIRSSAWGLRGRSSQ